MMGIVAAPSNLGLRPPETGAVPGCAIGPEAPREPGLYRGLAAVGAFDAGVVVPGRYRPDVSPGQVRNQAEILRHSRLLADRIRQVRMEGAVPLVLGGDCSLLVAAGLALHSMGRFGLVHLDGHTDFRHPGNSPDCASLAGEDLAVVVGRHWPAIANIDGATPYFRPQDVVHAGCRDDDDHVEEVRSVLASVAPARELTGDVRGAVAALLKPLSACSGGYWLHLDVDILDPEVMPAVDSPAPAGLQPADLRVLLRILAPGAVGADVTVYDPDLDPDGRLAKMLVDLLVDGLCDLGRAVR
jgi:arginase